MKTIKTALKNVSMKECYIIETNSEILPSSMQYREILIKLSVNYSAMQLKQKI